MLKKSLFVAACASLTLTGCSTVSEQFDRFNEWWQPGDALLSVIKPYRADMQQGNLVTKEMLDQLHVGMTQLQVQFLLGVPLLRDMFHENRWDYVYYVNPRFGDPETRRLTVYFDDEGRLSKYEFNDMPEETVADKIILGHDDAEFAVSDKITVVDRDQQTQRDIEQSAQ